MQAFFPDDFEKTVQKVDVPVRTEEDAHHFLVFLYKMKQIQQEGPGLQTGRLFFMEVHDLVEGAEHAVLDFFEHVIDILIIQIEGTAVHVRQIRQLPDGDFVDLLFLEQLSQGLGEELFGAANAAVFLFFG